MRWIAPLALLISLAPAARAQDSDEDVKRRIMDKVRERLAEERKRIMERMAGVVDDALSGKAPRAPAAGPKDARVRDLERKLQLLDDQREDILRDIRAIRRETEDAKIIGESKSVVKELEAAAEAQDEEGAREAFKGLQQDFNEYNRIHANQDYDKSILGFKKLYYGLRDSKLSQQTAGLWVPAAYNVACGYALQGKKTEAIDWLEVAIKAGYKDWQHIRDDADFDSIRKERRYQRLLADR